MAERGRFISHRLNNILHSVFILTGMGLLMFFLGWIIAGRQAVYWVVFIAVLLLLIGPKLSPQATLRLYGARPIDPSSSPALHAAAGKLAERAGLPRPPSLYHISSAIMNAFAVGSRKDSAIAMTDGLLRALTLREITGVLAHEISHVRDNDMWVMALADVVSRVTSTFSFVGQLLLFINLPLLIMGRYTISWLPILILVFSPTVSVLMQLALSRSREFDADVEAARLSGDPEGLASALKKMERYQGNLLERILMPGRKEPHPSLLRTHPVTAERIERLMSLADGQDQAGRERIVADDEDHHLQPPFEQTQTRPRWRIGRGHWY